MSAAEITVLHDDGYGQHVRGGDSRTALTEPTPNGKGQRHQAAVEARFGKWPDRFWAKVERTDGCWHWTGAIGVHGYGMSHGPHRSLGYMLAHRISYELTHGPIPEGLQIDHLCRTRSCVNPSHLDPVTPSENLLRKVACPKGHLYTEETTGYLSNGWRACLVCRRARRVRGQAAKLRRDRSTRYNARLVAARRCGHCEGPIPMGKRADAKFCSPECRKASHQRGGVS